LGCLSGLGQPAESTTVLRLKTVLNYAAGINPELKQSQSKLFVLAEEFSRLSQLYTVSDHGEDATTSAVRILIAITKVVAKICRRYGELLHRLITSVPNFHMDPCTKESLEIRLGHIGHYQPAARRLLGYANTFNVFRSIQIRPIHIRPYNLARDLCQHRPELQKARLIAETQNGERKDDWEMKLTHVVSNSQKEVKSHIARAQTEGDYKVHAEIQLICYYEQHPNTRFPPRVLKSSKHACFLCDLFIKTHGKYYISRTHGKAYYLWMLPDINELKLGKKTKKNLVRVIGEFNKSVERVIISSVLQAKRITIPEPYESGIFSIMPSSHAASNTTVYQRPGSEIAACLDTPLSTPIASTSTSREPTPTPVQSEELNQELEDPIPVPSSPPSQPELSQHTNEAQQIATPTSPPPTLVLQQGKPCTYIFDKTKPIARFHTPKIHVELSHEEAQQLADIDPSATDEKAADAITVEVSWLGSQDSNQSSTHKDHTVNLGSRWTELTATDDILFTDEGLLMRKGVDVVRVRALHVCSRHRQRIDSIHN